MNSIGLDEVVAMRAAGAARRTADAQGVAEPAFAIVNAEREVGRAAIASAILAIDRTEIETVVIRAGHDGVDRADIARVLAIELAVGAAAADLVALTIPRDAALEADVPVGTAGVRLKDGAGTHMRDDGISTGGKVSAGVNNGAVHFAGPRAARHCDRPSGCH